MKNIIRLPASSRTGRTPGCAVCDPRARTDASPIRLCMNCAHPQQVRAFCDRCEQRVSFTVERARAMFRLFGLDTDLVQEGLVIRYERDCGCPLCPGHVTGDVLHKKLFCIEGGIDDCPT